MLDGIGPFSLYSVLCHIGNDASSGHYTTFCRRANAWVFASDPVARWVAT
eukprot:gene7490-22731_t